MSTKTWVFVALASVIGWAVFQSNESKLDASRHAKAQLREAEVKKLLSSTKADVRVLDSEHGQMLIVEIPYKSDLSPGLAEKKRCMVWRDAWSKTTNMSCDPSGDFVVVE